MTDSESSLSQSPAYVISSISSAVLNKKETFNDTQLPTPTYENVDPNSGFPVAPHSEIVVTSEWTGRQPERAALPLVGIHAHRMATPHFTGSVVQPAEYKTPMPMLTTKQIKF